MRQAGDTLSNANASHSMQDPQDPQVTLVTLKGTIRASGEDSKAPAHRSRVSFAAHPVFEHCCAHECRCHRRCSWHSSR